jgi:V/A-type H+/Na+-transporting ATPase subunit D
MARVSLSKSSLAKQNRNLRTYEQYLPALDLKRKLIMSERAKEVRAREATRREIAALHERVQENLPMIANREIQLADLIKVRGTQIGTENVVGTSLPVLETLDVDRRDYGLMSIPHWVDAVADALVEMLTLRARLALHERRLAMLDAAVRKVTQRVNLFGKVLIPKARANIKLIQVYLSDTDRAAIVRSKIAKNKRLKEVQA